MNISQEARGLFDALEGMAYTANDGSGFLSEDALPAIQALIDQTIERCAAKADASAEHARSLCAQEVTDTRVAFMAASELVARDIRALKSNPTDGGKDER